MNEKTIENKLREAIKEQGGIALKFFSPYFTGMPDRMILLPGGRIRFAELKSTGRRPSDRQDYVITLLRRLGFTVAVIDNQSSLDEFLEGLADGI